MEAKIKSLVGHLDTFGDMLIESDDDLNDIADAGNDIIELFSTKYGEKSERIALATLALMLQYRLEKLIDQECDGGTDESIHEKN